MGMDKGRFCLCMCHMGRLGSKFLAEREMGKTARLLLRIEGKK